MKTLNDYRKENDAMFDSIFGSATKTKKAPTRTAPSSLSGKTLKSFRKENDTIFKDVFGF